MLNFTGGRDFLILLGFQPDDKHETLKCPINKPDNATLELATKVIKRALRILHEDNSTASSIPEQKWSRQNDSNRADYDKEWFDQDEVEECETINNILGKGLNPEIRNVLLLVYKTFCSSEMLLRVLMQRWKASDYQVRKKILDFCVQ